jgi:hypothetical protein
MIELTADTGCGGVDEDDPRSSVFDESRSSVFDEPRSSLWSQDNFPDIVKQALKAQVGQSTGVWQGVVTDSLKFHPGQPCPTLLRPAGQVACGHLLPFWTPHVVYLWVNLFLYQFSCSNQTSTKESCMKGYKLFNCFHYFFVERRKKEGRTYMEI